MASPTKRSKKAPPRSRGSHKRTAVKSKKPASHSRARPRKTPKLAKPPQPLARDLIAAVGSTGSTNGEIKVTKAQARKIAVEFGGAMLEATNLETARHSDDVVLIAQALCERLGIKGAKRQDLLAAARLHDIGKAALPDGIIEKPGPLSEDEWEQMRKHTIFGEQILGAVAELEGIARLVRHSHERWDGRGYPDGLSGGEIPLGSRVIFCADSFHAIRSDRPYRRGRSAATALAEIKRCSGTQFDPEVVEAFEQVVRELRLAPASARRPRSSRLTALLLMLSIGTAGSAVASSDLLGEPGPSAGGAPAQHGLSLSQPQLLGTSFDDMITAQRSRGAGLGVGLGLGAGVGGAGDRIEDGPAPGGASRPGGDSGEGTADQSQGGSGDSGSSSGGGSGASPGNSGDNPHGGPPGQTGSNPGQGGGGPPGQSGGGPPGQSGGGPPGQSGSAPGKSSGEPPGQSSGGPQGQGNKPK